MPQRLWLRRQNNFCCQSHSLSIFLAAELLGDPHITTLDGYLVTFNGIGEYILLTSNEFVFQGRMEQVTINGEKKDASYITVLAAKQLNPDSGTVRMQATNASELGKIFRCAWKKDDIWWFPIVIMKK